MFVCCVKALYVLHTSSSTHLRHAIQSDKISRVANSTTGNECDKRVRRRAKGERARAEAEERGGRARDTAARGDGRAVRSDEVIT